MKWLPLLDFALDLMHSWGISRRNPGPKSGASAMRFPLIFWQLGAIHFGTKKA